MKKKEFYKYKIKEGAYKKMTSILKYFETGQAIIDGSLCCIVTTISVEEKVLKDPKLSASTILYQIKIYNSKTEQQALISPELLEEMEIKDWVIVDAIV